MTATEAIRLELRRTQDEFGALIGRGKAMVSLYESGAKVPPVKLAVKILEVAKKRGVALEMDLDQFYATYGYTVKGVAK